MLRNPASCCARSWRPEPTFSGHARKELAKDKLTTQELPLPFFVRFAKLLPIRVNSVVAGSSLRASQPRQSLGVTRFTT